MMTELLLLIIIMVVILRLLAANLTAPFNSGTPCYAGAAFDIRPTTGSLDAIFFFQLRVDLVSTFLNVHFVCGLRLTDCSD